MEVLKRNFVAEQVQDNYSNVAWFYNLWAKLTETKAEKKTLEYAEIKNGDKILEVAAGTGILFEEIVKINSSGVNEAIDISPQMIKHAEKKLANKNLNYHIQQGSAYDLKYDNNSFDLIINNFMFDLLPVDDFAKILKEFYRVLKPGGRVVISTMSFGQKWYNKIWFYISKHFQKLMTGCRPIDLKSYITQAGFGNLRSVYISQCTLPSEVIKAEKTF